VRKIEGLAERVRIKDKDKIPKSIKGSILTIVANNGGSWEGTLKLSKTLLLSSKLIGIPRADDILEVIDHFGPNDCGFGKAEEMLMGKRYLRIPRRDGKSGYELTPDGMDYVQDNFFTNHNYELFVKECHNLPLSTMDYNKDVLINASYIKILRPNTYGTISHQLEREHFKKPSIVHRSLTYNAFRYDALLSGSDIEFEYYDEKELLPEQKRSLLDDHPCVEPLEIAEEKRSM